MRNQQRRVLRIVKTLYEGEPVPYDAILEGVHPRFNGSRFEWPDGGWPEDPDDALSAQELDAVLEELVNDGELELVDRGEYIPADMEEDGDE